MGGGQRFFLAKDDRAFEPALDFLQDPVFLATQGLHDFRRRADGDRFPRGERAQKLQDFAPDLERDGEVVLDAAVAATAGAGPRQHAIERGARALARDLNEAELGDLQDFRLRPILLHLRLEGLEERAPVLLVLEVDEVHDENASQVPQPYLANDLAYSLEVDREDGLFETVLSDKFSGVDVDRDERFGGIDHEVSAGFEPDLRLERLFNLRLHSEFFKQG